MKKTTLIISILLVFCMSNSLKSQEMTNEQKKSYALGANVGESFRSAEITINESDFLIGLRDALTGNNKFSQAEMQQIFEMIDQEIRAKQSSGSAEEMAKGAAFLAENKKNKDVVETPSGLQYKVVTMGNGAKPTATDQVRVHYHGTLIDGQVFDSSVQRGETITFGLNQVIPGWTEGVQLMPVGSKFIFYIPSNLAYGDRNMGIIKAGATLIFEVELFEINPK